LRAQSAADPCQPGGGFQVNPAGFDGPQDSFRAHTEGTGPHRRTAAVHCRGICLVRLVVRWSRAGRAGAPLGARPVRTVQLGAARVRDFPLRRLAGKYARRESGDCRRANRRSRSNQFNRSRRVRDRAHRAGGHHARHADEDGSHLSMAATFRIAASVSAGNLVSTRRVLWIALALIVALAALVRVVPLTYSHFWDETVFLQHAKVILDGRTNYQEFFHRPPLLSVLYALGFALWDNIYVANIVQAIVTTLAVLFAFLYVRGAFGVVCGMAAAFLFAFTPYLVETSHELLTDMPAVAFMLAAMWLFDKPGPRFAILAGATYALAIQTRFTSLFLIVYFALDASLSLKKLRQLVILLVAAGITIAPYLIWVRWNYGSVLFPFVLARRIVTEWTAPVPARFYFDAVLEIFPPSLWLFFALGLCSPVTRWGSRYRSEGEAVPAENPGLSSQAKRQLVLLMWGLLFFAYMLTIGHKEIRYLLPLAIPVVIVSALSVTALFRWIARQAKPVWVAGVLLGVAVAVADYASPFQKL